MMPHQQRGSMKAVKIKTATGLVSIRNGSLVKVTDSDEFRHELTEGKRYKVENTDKHGQIYVTNDVGAYFGYDGKRFQRVQY